MNSLRPAHRRLPHFGFVVAAVALLAWPGPGRAAEPAAPPPIAEQPLDPDHAAKMERGLALFTEQVRPLLIDRCLKCHGGEAIEGKLDLSNRDGLLRGGASGPAIVLGKPRESLLYELVAHARQPHMPYEEEQLAEADIALLAAWIENLAPYDAPLVETKAEETSWTERVLPDDARQFWSFQPLARVEPPAVSDAAWCRTEVDRFILARLETAAIAPNPPATRRQLVRRVYFDLIGLPPTPEEVAAFVDDPDPNAYERLIDRLLFSPHYGERWARHWLDLVRFAESHGFEHDYDRPTAYHYRDFVVQALNADLPYDRFVQWQIAGDELAPDNNLALMATGFLAAGVHSTQITKNEAEKHRYDEMDDMLATLGTSMLGLTIGCARCHDHKFDPIPQRDYYQLLSTFTTTVRTEVELDFDPETYRTAKAAFDTAHAPLAAALQKFEAEELSARFAAWEQARPAESAPPGWIVLDVTDSRSAGGATFVDLDDGSLQVGGTNPDFDTYIFTAETQLTGIAALRLEALADPSLVAGGPGRASNGNFALSDVKVAIAPRSDASAAVDVPLVNPRATFEQGGLPIAATIDADERSAWAVDPQFGQDHAAGYDFAMLVGHEGGSVLTVTLRFNNNAGHNIGRTRLSIATASAALDLRGDGVPQEIVAALAVPAAERTPEQTAALLSWYRSQDPHWQALRRAVEEHLQQEPKPALSKVLISSEGLPPVRLHSQGDDFLPETHFLRRGDPNQKEAVAAQGFLQAITPVAEHERWRTAPPPESKLSYRRTALAHWLTDADGGAGALLARAIVNRLWQHHLGRGIVATPSDFGTRGELPSHPELLDWLAGELIARGWSLKEMHKLILGSAVYRQSAAANDVAATVDPDNRLCWRHPRRRLEAEVVRDAVLSVGGILDPAQFGPGTLDEASLRRSIYFTVKRSKLMPMMQVFDAPDALSSIGERPSTTIAPQALLLMNNAQTRYAARGFARRAAGAGESPEAQVAAAYAIALARQPTAEELADGIAFLAEQTASYSSAGQTEPAHLALMDFCQVLMCLNEFVYID